MKITANPHNFNASLRSLCLPVLNFVWHLLKCLRRYEHLCAVLIFRGQNIRGAILDVLESDLADLNCLHKGSNGSTLETSQGPDQIFQKTSSWLLSGTKQLLL